MADVEQEEGTGKTKKLVAGFTLLLLLVVAGRLYLTWRERREDANAVAPRHEPEYHVTADDLVVPRKLYPSSLKDARALDGHRVWVFAAGQMRLYPATPAHVDYAHPAGLLLGAEPLDVTNFIEQAAPPGVYNIPRGDRHVLMLFHRASEPGKLYGTPVGYEQDGSDTFYLDEAFFYDDPHGLYKEWSPEIWAAIDQHRAIDGMNERQVNLALGQVSTPGPGSVNNRTVTYDNQGHPVTVTFAAGKATKVQADG